MNKKILFGIVIVLVIAMIAGACFLLTKQKTQKVYRVGILSGLNLFIGIVDGFKGEMTKLGYIEGKNIIYDLQKLDNSGPETEKAVLKKFVEDKVDLILGYNTEVALEAKDVAEGTGIPVIFANAFTEGNDLVKNVREPGGNITGVRYPGVDVAVKRLEILHEIVPEAKRIWLPYQKDYPSVAPELGPVRQAAASLNLALIEFSAEDLTSLQVEMERLSKLEDIGFDAVLFIPEPLSTLADCFEIIANVTRSRKIPIGGSAIVTQDYGTLFAVTIDSVAVGKLAAPLADKILKGTNAGTIPVVSPQSILKLNYKVAQELGLTFSEGLLNRAVEIIR